MSLIILTEQERDRFAAYCRQEAENHDKMSKQMEKLGGLPAGPKRERHKAIAFLLVAHEVDPDSYETQTISG